MELAQHPSAHPRPPRHEVAVDPAVDCCDLLHQAQDPGSVGFPPLPSDPMPISTSLKLAARPNKAQHKDNAQTAQSPLRDAWPAQGTRHFWRSAHLATVCHRGGEQLKQQLDPNVPVACKAKGACEHARTPVGLGEA